MIPLSQRSAAALAGIWKSPTTLYHTAFGRHLKTAVLQSKSRPLCMNFIPTTKRLFVLWPFPSEKPNNRSGFQLSEEALEVNEESIFGVGLRFAAQCI